MQAQRDQIREVIWEAFAAVGLQVTSADLDQTLENLDVDSLARAEIASHVKSRLGVDIEPALTADTTPAQVCDLVAGAVPVAGC